MNIYQAILTVWQNSELATLIPPERVFTARNPNPENERKYPFAVYTRIASIPRFRTSKANCDVEMFQLSIFAETYTEAEEILTTARDVLRDSKPTSHDGTVCLFEKGPGTLTLEEGRITHSLDEYFAEISKDRRA